MGFAALYPSYALNYRFQVGAALAAHLISFLPDPGRLKPPLQRFFFVAPCENAFLPRYGQQYD